MSECRASFNFLVQFFHVHSPRTYAHLEKIEEMRATKRANAYVCFEPNTAHTHTSTDDRVPITCTHTLAHQHTIANISLSVYTFLREIKTAEKSRGGYFFPVYLLYVRWHFFSRAFCFVCVVLSTGTLISEFLL